MKQPLSAPKITLSSPWNHLQVGTYFFFYFLIKISHIVLKVLFQDCSWPGGQRSNPKIARIIGKTLQDTS